MDKIVLFHFNNLLVVTLVTGFLKHSRMPVIVICISMSRSLSLSLSAAAVLSAVGHLSHTDTRVLSLAPAAESYATYLSPVCRS